MATRKCFIFTIGGTGARVLESLTYMLAAGSEYNSLYDWEFVPIIIDLDKNNGNLKKCIKLMDKYRAIHSSVNPEENLNYRFFRYPIRTLKEVTGHNQLSNDYILASHLAANGNLESLISYPTLGNSSNTNGTRELVDLFYTKEDREMRLDKGFKGKPHIGSMFFEQFSDMAENQEGALNIFMNNFDSTKDRIFIISSIFGGTGAAGFPWLVKFLRKQNVDIDKMDNAKIAALSVQPYFTVDASSNSDIDSNSFHTKTKSALKYYSKNLENQLNSIYYIGDSESGINMKNAEGGDKQANTSSPIELIGATSIFHFLAASDENLQNQTSHYAYGLNTSDTDKYTIYWNDLKANPGRQRDSRKRFFTPFLHFHISNIMISRMLEEVRTITWAVNTDLFEKDQKSTFLHTIWDKSFLTNNFYKDLKGFMQIFTNWLDELKGSSSAQHLTYYPFEVRPEIGEIPNFLGLLNTIIKYTDLTEGKDLLLEQYNKGNTTYIVHGKNQLVYNRLVEYINRSNLIKQANKIKVSNNKQKQQAQRFMYLVYNASLELLKDNTAQAVEIDKFLIN